MHVRFFVCYHSLRKQLPPGSLSSHLVPLGDAPLELHSDRLLSHSRWLLSASDPTIARRPDTSAVVRVEYIGRGIALRGRILLGSMSD